MSNSFSGQSQRLSSPSLSTDINQPTTNQNPLNVAILPLSASSNAPIAGQPLVVYDGSTNRLLDSTNGAANGPWFYYQSTTQFLGGTATNSVVSGGTRLVTDNSAYAGYINYQIGGTPTNPQLTTLNNNFPVLDRTTGYVISFTARLESETTRTATANKNGDNLDDRAGFSVTIIGNDQRGIELGFWSDRIWAQNDGAAEPTPNNLQNTLFTQGEGVNFNTTTQAVKYDLAVIGNTYSLFADNNRILTGNIRDYTAFQPSSYNVNSLFGSITVNPPDPYEQPNFVFFGDNTPTAGATVSISNVAVTTNQNIPNQTVNFGESTPALRLKVADVDNNTLTITGTSNDQGLIANSNIVIAGTGSDRTIIVTPSANLAGTARITLTISDGTNTINRVFSVTVNPVEITESQTKHDFDGDGKAEVLWRNLTTGQNAIWQLNNFAIGNSALIDPVITDANWKLVTTGDFNGDGKADMLWRNTATGENAVWLRNGFNAFDPNSAENSRRVITTAPIGWNIVGTSDLNGDGNDDIVWRNQTTGENAAWLMNGFSANTQFLSNRTIPLDWEIVGIGYLDGDDNADLVWRNRQNGENAIWLMNGTQVKEARFIRTITDQNWRIVGVADSNNDGIDEIAWQNQSNGETAIWSVNTTQLNGDNFTTTAEFVVKNNTRMTVTSDWKFEAFSDYNDDGKADFLWRNYLTGETALWWLDQFNVTQNEFITANGSVLRNSTNWEITL